jgi:tRNA (guanine37-N1)-methyltransferase
MRFELITLFPEAFPSLLETSLVGKAIRSGLITVNFVDPRSFTDDKHRTVDDTPYGGGDGMVIKCEPLVSAIESIVGQGGLRPHRVLLTPQGRPMHQSDLEALARRGHLILICGRYEGFDERIRAYADEELSLGDFVLNGGEVAAMAVLDGVARLIPGVIGNADSLACESHSEGLLEYPQYTRPPTFRGVAVPEVLLSGDHQRIKRWRHLQRLVRTHLRRPDLFRQRALPPEEQAELTALGIAREASAEDARSCAARAYVALLHHPVYDREGRIVTTAVTNLDIHDIARSARTYGLGGYFIITPLSSQRELVQRIIGHWREGHGRQADQDRREALSLVRVCEALEEALCLVEQETGSRPLTVATSAQPVPDSVSIAELAGRLTSRHPVLILLGTGWGLTRELVQRVDLRVAGIRGVGAYNHLSVRSAAAILLDRIFGMREEQ